MAHFVLPASVTVAEAGEVVRQALGALRAAPTAQLWEVDAAALRDFDSACLALLLELRRQAGDRALRVLSAPPRLAHLATAYGLDFALGEAAAAPPGPELHS
ncbi:conserved hypothetical protein [Thiomonas sp. X19]|uniref:STAS domain-containing protein n=1 Tax=Thiomonas sp. X19 TaxID=1050370 RepID=UPI000B645327|nr:STAS domain-containing protein [Thiomonas sp. X19]SCC95580.1 conserved hypothetical protein [Thiomonas sp. X19]